MKIKEQLKIGVTCGVVCSVLLTLLLWQFGCETENTKAVKRVVEPPARPAQPVYHWAYTGKDVLTLEEQLADALSTLEYLDTVRWRLDRKGQGYNHRERAHYLEVRVALMYIVGNLSEQVAHERALAAALVDIQGGADAE